MKERILNFMKAQWREWRGVVFFVVFVLVPVKSSLADWNWVPSSSMNPTIVEGDMVFVNKLAYDLRVPLTMHRLKQWADPARGDIVVVLSPEDRTRLVKRVVGIPGDRISMRNNAIFLNGEWLDYAPLSAEYTKDLMPELRRQALFAEEDLAGCKHAVMSIPSVPAANRNFEEVAVPEGKYFIMGDNRDVSLDSRVYGFADRNLVLGKATNVVVSFNILDKYQPRIRRFFEPLR